MNVHINVLEDEKFIQNINRFNKEFILTYLGLYKSQHKTLPNDIFVKITMILNDASKMAFEQYFEQENIPTYFGSDESDFNSNDGTHNDQINNEVELKQQNDESVSGSNDRTHDLKLEQQKHETPSGSNNDIQDNQQEELENETVSDSNSHTLDNQADIQNEPKDSANVYIKDEQNNATFNYSNSQEEPSEKWSDKVKSKSVEDGVKQLPKARNIQKNIYTDSKGRDRYEQTKNKINSSNQDRTKYDCLVCDCEVYLHNKNHGTPACKPCLEKLTKYGWNGICFYHFSPSHECSYGDKCNKWHGQKDDDDPIPY